MKTGKMRGFMCQPHASTAVCVPGDARSVVVPRRPDRTLIDHARIVDLKYTRLVDSRRFNAPAREEMVLQIAKAPTTKEGDQRRLQMAMVPVVTVPTTAGGDHKGLEMAMVPVTAKTAPAPLAAVVKRERNVAVPTLPSSSDHVFQVVVMRVSLHCQGCAGKVKKHISKMEGVTSFSIDLESKRVTVMGHVSPAGVLESISKVKKAEFWPSTTPVVKA